MLGLQESGFISEFPSSWNSQQFKENGYTSGGGNLSELFLPPSEKGSTP